MLASHILKTSVHCVGFQDILLLKCKNRYIHLNEPATCWRGQNGDCGVRGSELSSPEQIRLPSVPLSLTDMN